MSSGPREDRALAAAVRAQLVSAGHDGAAHDVARLAQAAAAAPGDPYAHATTLVERVLAGEPVAYVTGHVSFMGLELLAAPGALVPRAETELLGHTTCRVLGEMALDTPRVIDMCCGSGNLACAIAAHDTRVTVWASDVTPESVTLATRNVAHTGLSGRVHVHCGDLFAPLTALGIAGTIDAVVCNPPYISQGRLAGDRAGLLAHEPREAFDGGPYGLTIHQRVIREATAFLRTGGVLLFEIGAGQERQLHRLFERTGMYDDYRTITDHEGLVRVVTARVSDSPSRSATHAPEPMRP